MQAAPKAILAGIGCREAAAGDEVIGLIAAALAEAGLAAEDLALIATGDWKAAHPAIRAAAAHFGVPLRGVARAELSAMAVPTPSDTVARHMGVASIAEGAVLAHGALLLPKRRSANATCALGRLGAR